MTRQESNKDALRHRFIGHEREARQRMAIILVWLLVWFLGLCALPLVATVLFEAENGDRVLVAFLWTVLIATLSVSSMK